MAKLALTFTLLCLFFFAFSQARFQADLPLNDAVGTEILPEADQHEISTTADSIALPTDKPESDWQSVTTVPVKLEAIEENDAVPLTVVRFRPVNRHFPRRPFPLTLRHGRRCRQHFKPWGPRRPHADGDLIPFGDDMILSGGDRLGSDPVFRDGVRQIPARWIKIRHVEPRFPLRHGDEIEWPHHHHRHHHHHDRDGDGDGHHDHDHDRDGDGDGDGHHDHDHDHHEHENPFLKGFRKFMNHF